MTATATKPTQIDRALAALLDCWLGPEELTRLSTRRNPEGIRRDAKGAAYKHGLWWHERQVVPVEGKPYKACCVTRGPLWPGSAATRGVRTYPPGAAIAARRVLEGHLARTGAVVEALRGGPAQKPPAPSQGPGRRLAPAQLELEAK